MVASSVVDWELLGQAVLTSVAFGLGVVLAAGIAVSCSLRARDARAAGNEATFVALGAVTVLGVLAIVAAIIGGIWVMTQ